MLAIKKCGCGIEHQIITISASGGRLEYVKYILHLPYKGSMMGLDLYDCPCGSTIAIEPFKGFRDKFIEQLKTKSTKAVLSVEV